jgi:hypothetical protein
MIDIAMSDYNPHPLISSRATRKNPQAMEITEYESVECHKDGFPPIKSQATCGLVEGYRNYCKVQSI